MPATQNRHWKFHLQLGDTPAVVGNSPGFLARRGEFTSLPFFVLQSEALLPHPTVPATPSTGWQFNVNFQPALRFAIDLSPVYPSIPPFDLCRGVNGD